MRRPIPIATAERAFLIVLGLPFFNIKFNTVDPTVLPKDASARQAYDTISADFPPYRETPIWVTVEGGGPARRRRSRPGSRVEGSRRSTRRSGCAAGVTVIQAISENPFDSEASKSR